MTEDHVTKQGLVALLEGAEDSAVSGPATEHLNTCERCRRALDDLAAQSSVWKRASEHLKDRQDASAGVSPSGLSDGGEPWALRPGSKPPEPTSWNYPIDALLDAPKHPEMLGSIGGYDIEREIGRGGMGVVLKAHDMELNRPLAIKILAPHLAGNGTARQRFAQEAKAAAGVIHPNVIAVHGVSNEGKTPYIIMPYVSGPSLQSLVDQKGPLTEIEVVRIALQIASGLAAAHSQGLVHRDIKPANILVEAGGNRVLITDFGLARAEDDASLTGTGWLTGTPNYMSPEQARGDRLDARSDLFSLGSLLYFLCTGRLPFRSETALGVLNRIREDEPTPVRQVTREASKTLADMIALLHQKSPSMRCPSAVDLRQILERHLAFLHQPETSKPPKVHVPGAAKDRSVLRAWAWGAAAAISVPGLLLWVVNSLGTPGSTDAAIGRGLQPNAGAAGTESFRVESSSTTSSNAGFSGASFSGMGSPGEVGQGPTPSRNQERVIQGTWSADLSLESVELSISHKAKNGVNTVTYSSDYALDAFETRLGGGSETFRLVRPSGTVTFQGVFAPMGPSPDAAIGGAGEFTFEGSAELRAKLAEAGIEDAPNGLLFSFFFGRDLKDFLRNAKGLRELGIEIEPGVRRILMIEGAPPLSVKAFRDAGLSLAENLPFVCDQVPTELVLDYEAAGFSPPKHASLLLARVEPSLLTAYRTAGLSLTIQERFLHAKVPSALLLEYRAAGLDLYVHEPYISGQVPASLIMAYKDEGLVLAEYDTLLRNRVPAAWVRSYLDAGIDPLEHLRLINGRVKPLLITKYIRAGLHPHHHQDSLLEGLSADEARAKERSTK